MKKWIFIVCFVFMYIGNSFAGEQIADFEKKSLPVLNEELNRLDKEIKFVIPVGVIVLWSGAITDIPDGWVICDGENDTPDLTDSFVIHADADSGGTRNVGDTGGSHTKDISHTHARGTYALTAGAGGIPSDGASYFPGVAGTSASGGSATQDIIPKFYALAYIMKISEI